MSEADIKAEAESYQRQVHDYYERYKNGQSTDVAKVLGGLEIPTVDHSNFRRPGPSAYDENIMKAIAKKVIPDTWDYTVVSMIGQPPVVIMIQRKKDSIDFHWMENKK